MIGQRETRLLAANVGLGMLLALIVWSLLDDEDAHNRSLVDAERSTPMGTEQEPVSVPEGEEQGSSVPSQKESAAELDRTPLGSAAPEIEERAGAPLDNVEVRLRSERDYNLPSELESCYRGLWFFCGRTDSNGFYCIDVPCLGPYTIGVRENDWSGLSIKDREMLVHTNPFERHFTVRGGELRGRLVVMRSNYSGVSAAGNGSGKPNQSRSRRMPSRMCCSSCRSSDQGIYTG